MCADLASRRRAAAFLRNEIISATAEGIKSLLNVWTLVCSVSTLSATLTAKGRYTRALKTGPRRGDGANGNKIIELV